MTLGLPSHLAPQTIGYSFSRALHTVAYICLAAALVATVAFVSAHPEATLWPALTALLPIGSVLYLSDRFQSGFFSIAYLAIGAASVYWFCLTLYSQSFTVLGGDAFPTALPKLALVMVGGTGASLFSRIAWTLAGYGAAEFAVNAAAVVAGHPLHFDATTLLCVVATVGIFVVTSIGRRDSSRTQPMLHRAARDEQLAAMRFRLEVKAAALMHDTVLSHLAAIADSTRSNLDPQLARQIERDLATLVGEEWLADTNREVDLRTHEGWKSTALYTAIEESIELGLEVDSTGDLAAVCRLPEDSAESLGLAVKQCLVNVWLHSGVTRAEVAVFGSDTEVSVMVIDAGRGFSEAETSPDRMGIRQSIRQRMEAVGATVQIWSTLGRGTSIMIRVPVVAAIDEAAGAR